MIQIKVPARVCFFGDHQDYLGLPVIAGAIDRFIHLEAVPFAEKCFHLQLRDLGITRMLDIMQLPAEVTAEDYLQAALVVLQQKGLVFDQGYLVTISGDIPLNAGLSSSSALTVAWIRFLIAIQPHMQVSDTEIGQWAYEVEVEFFRQSGGIMDQYTIAQKGLIYINTTTNVTERLRGSMGTIVVAESGLEKQTQEVLKNARLWQEEALVFVKNHHPNFDVLKATVSDYHRYLGVIPQSHHHHWYATIINYDITKKAKNMLLDTTDRRLELARLMNQHQQILSDYIQNTPLPMSKMMQAAIGAGALAAKTIGSGGGGCMLAMVDEEVKDKVIRAFLAKGAKSAYEVQLVTP